MKNEPCRQISEKDVDARSIEGDAKARRRGGGGNERKGREGKLNHRPFLLLLPISSSSHQQPNLAIEHSDKLPFSAPSGRRKDTRRRALFLAFQVSFFSFPCPPSSALVLLTPKKQAHSLLTSYK